MQILFWIDDGCDFFLYLWTYWGVGVLYSLRPGKIVSILSYDIVCLLALETLEGSSPFLACLLSSIVMDSV